MALGQFAPGPDMVLLTRTALSNGRAAGVAMAGGIASGLIIHAGLALCGMASLLAQGGWLSVALTLAASVYLAWMGWQLFCSARAGGQIDWSSGEMAQNGSIALHWRRGFICNILNPKVAIFLAGIVTPFLEVSSASWWPWLLWLTVWLEGFILWSLWVILLQRGGVRKKYAKVSRWIDGAFGITLWGMTLMLLCRLV